MEQFNKELFADYVLQLLDESDEWDADLTDAIGSQAIALGLGFSDEQGLFRRVKTEAIK